MEKYTRSLICPKCDGKKHRINYRPKKQIFGHVYGEAIEITCLYCAYSCDAAPLDSNTIEQKNV